MNEDIIFSFEFSTFLKIRSAYFGAINIVNMTRVQDLLSDNIFKGIFISSSDRIEVL